MSHFGVRVRCPICSRQVGVLAASTPGSVQLRRHVVWRGGFRCMGSGGEVAIAPTMATMEAGR
jgi:hypothetical protein